jgi:hypothetical protein
VGRNGGGDVNKQQAGDVGKNDLADAPSTPNDRDVSVTIKVLALWKILFPECNNGILLLGWFRNTSSFAP